MKSLNSQLIKTHLYDIDTLLLELVSSFEDSEEEEKARYFVDAVEEHISAIRKYLN